jgi:hypothetical protein
MTKGTRLVIAIDALPQSQFQRRPRRRAGALIADETEKWGKVIRAANIKAE